jgi:3-methyladenine DNA glycosylase AlkD
MAERLDEAVQVAAASLREKADPVAAPGRKAYLKTSLEVLGCTVPTVRAAAKAAWHAHKTAERTMLIGPLELLWASPVHDDRILAIALAQLFRDRFTATDVAGLFTGWLRDCRTWDLTDGLSTDVVGWIALRDPDAWPVIAGWTGDDWMWRRRASILAHIPAIRRGTLRVEQFRESCVALIDEREFFIRKAIGWALREIATWDPDLIERLLLDFGHRASGLSLREATRRLPVERRAGILDRLQRTTSRR